MHTRNHSNTCQKLVLGASTLLVVAWCWASAGADNSPADGKAAMEQQTAQSNRLQTVSRFLQIIESSDAESAKIAAVRSLGEMRAEEAVPILVRNLDLGAGPAVLAGSDPFQKAFPVRDALKKIGRPAVPFIFSEVRTTDDPQKLWQLVFTLASIVGNEETRTMIESLAKDEQLSAATRDALKLWVERLRPPDAAPGDGE